MLCLLQQSYEMLCLHLGGQEVDQDTSHHFEM